VASAVAASHAALLDTVSGRFELPVATPNVCTAGASLPCPPVNVIVAGGATVSGITAAASVIVTFTAVVAGVPPGVAIFKTPVYVPAARPVVFTYTDTAPPPFAVVPEAGFADNHAAVEAIV